MAVYLSLCSVNVIRVVLQKWRCVVRVSISQVDFSLQYETNK